MTTSERIYEIAQADIGTWEWKGDDHNPKVMAYYREAGHPEIKNDEVPWCAAFVGSVLAKAGARNTGSLMARSYANWGEPVDISQAKRGDVVVLSRGAPPSGHVGFFDRAENGYIYLLGGNQGDQVNISPYKVDRLVAIRRPKQPRTNPTQSKTVKVSATQIATGVGSASGAIGYLDGTAQIVALVVAGIIVLSALWIMRDRLSKWAEGVR